MTDIFTRQRGLDRRRALLEQLTQLNQETPIQGHTGFAQLLAKLGTAWLQKGAQQDLEKEESATSTEYNQLLQKELSDRMRQMKGAPGETLSTEQARALLQQDVAPPPLAEPTPADPQGAVMAAMTSRFPELQGMGKAMMPAILKAMSSKAAPKPLVVKGKIIDPNDVTKVLADHSGPDLPQGMMLDPTTGKPVWIPGYLEGKASVAKAGASSQSVKLNMPKAETKFAEQLGSKLGTTLAEEVNKRPDQIEMVQHMNQGLELVDQGIHTGIFGEYKLIGDKALAALQLKDPKKAARTEQFRAFIGSTVLPKMKDLGGNDTKEEFDKLQSFAAGDIKLEADAIKKILRSAQAKIMARADRTARDVEAWRQSGGQLPPLRSGDFPALYESPPPLKVGGSGASAPAAAAAPSTQQPQVIPFEEYMKQLKRGSR